MKTFSILSLVASATAVSVSVPSAVPTNASPAVEKAFLGLGIETWSFPNYTGSASSPNNFSLNIFKALTSRNPGLPIRIGGDAGDRVTYVPDQTVPVQFGSTPGHTVAPDNGFDTSKVGPSFFDGLKLVENAKWIYQVPMLANNLSNAIDYMSAAIKAMPSGSFQALEMGNEPTQYGSLAPKEFGTWGPQAYVNMWKNWTATLTSQVPGLPKDVPNYWTLSLPDIPSPGATWNVSGAFQDGLSSVAKTIQAVSLHFYQKDSSAGVSTLSSAYMNHTTIVSSLAKAQDSLKFLQTTNPVVPLLLGEVGPGGCASPCRNQIASSFGTGIWAIDFSLHLMQLGVQRVNFHQVDGSLEASWHPVEIIVNGTLTPPVVQGLFYGQLFIAELLGQLKGEIRVAELAVSPSDPNIVAYAVYDAGAISKVVIINNNLWLTSSTGTRPVTEVTVGGFGSNSKGARVDVLAASAADQHENISWAGQSWTFANGGVPDTRRTNNTVTFNGGSVTIPIDATQVVLLSVL